MITSAQFRKLALSFPESVELPHFDKASFRIGKKIFATLDQKEKRVCIKLNEVDQDVFCSYDREVIYPVPNKWGKQGWTLIELSSVKKAILTDALETAYRGIAPAKLKEKLKSRE